MYEKFGIMLSRPSPTCHLSFMWLTDAFVSHTFLTSNFVRAVWFGLSISITTSYESHTFQRWLQRWMSKFLR